MSNNIDNLINVINDKEILEKNKRDNRYEKRKDFYSDEIFELKELFLEYLNSLKKTDEPIKYYTYIPHFINNFGYENKNPYELIDDFSLKSIGFRIGIKTNVNKEYVPIILIFLYIINNNFKLTSDEVIFEKNYRNNLFSKNINGERLLKKNITEENYLEKKNFREICKFFNLNVENIIHISNTSLYEDNYLTLEELKNKL
jgi:hypothetical protein